MSRRTGAIDVLIVGGVLAFGQAEVWNTSTGAANLVGPQWANAAAYGAASLLLLARRRRPLAVLVGLCAVLSAEVIVFGASESLGALLPVLVGVYSVAAYGARRQMIAGGVAATAWIVIHSLRDPALSGAGDMLGGAAFAVLLPLAWLLETTRRPAGCTWPSWPTGSVALNRNRMSGPGAPWPRSGLGSRGRSTT